jgi:hypothetical protein
MYFPSISISLRDGNEVTVSTACSASACGSAAAGFSALVASVGLVLAVPFVEDVDGDDPVLLE